MNAIILLLNRGTCEPAEIDGGKNEPAVDGVTATALQVKDAITQLIYDYFVHTARRSPNTD